MAAGSVAAMAQLAPLSGRVVMDGADGKKVGVPGALVEVYRTDIKATMPSAKTDKNGNFAFAGLPFVGVYILSVSGPSIEPHVFPNVKSNNDSLTLTVGAGNGEKFTEEQARSGAALSSSGGTAELTAEQKKAQADYAAKRKEAEAKNEKIKNATQVIQASFTAGNEALKTNNYDVAIQKYDEGIAADPEFIGSVPALSNNRGIAYKQKALDERNKAIKETDVTAKADGLARARKDLDEAITSFMRSWNMLKGAGPTDEFPKANNDASKSGALMGARDTLSLAARMELVDQPMMDAAKILIPQYVASESDAAKKADAQLIIADLYRVNGDYAAAVDAYKKVLETAPENPDALVGAGLCLFAMGAVNNNDKAMYQEGANYLQKYVSVAPDGHKYKADAQAILEQLKNEQKVTPQKLPTTTTRKRG
ncbi:MAG: tetratricopeptide repeat protein [Pyrinomonadaceae bacterium]